MTCLNSPALVDRPLRVLLCGLIVLCSFRPIARGAPPVPSHRPRVIADTSFVAGLVATPLPDYPVEAVEKKWSGRGVFELHFRPDGTVADAVTVLTTGHRLLDQTARSALLQWRCKPGAQRIARLRISFLDRPDNDEVKPGGEKARANLLYAPRPRYPYEARRLRQTGYGVFILRFRPDGTVSDVVALKWIGVPVLDKECLSTFQDWRCYPGAFTTIQVPIHFTMAGAGRP